MNNKYLMKYDGDIKKILLHDYQLNTKLEELAKKLYDDYNGKDVVFVCVLNGAVYFFKDLINELNFPIEVGYMNVSSYDGTKSIEMKVIQDLSNKEGLNKKHIVIVEDILDTGKTLKFLTEYLKTFNPLSIKTCVLIDKIDCHDNTIIADYIGFQIANEFIVGYGMDYNEKYRSLPFVCSLNEQIYNK